jgi:hypothetical protein
LYFRSQEGKKGRFKSSLKQPASLLKGTISQKQGSFKKGFKNGWGGWVEIKKLLEILFIKKRGRKITFFIG